MRCNLEAPFANLLDIFNGGMDRDFPYSLSVGADGGNYLNLGAGKKLFTWAKPLQLPEWDGETQAIPSTDESVDGIIAFHFFEHISGARVPGLLAECERVLKPGGTLNICVPHYMGVLAFHDLDHKSFYTSTTWKNLMDNEYYKTKWDGLGKLKIHLNTIMGDSERTLALITQMVK